MLNYKFRGELAIDTWGGIPRESGEFNGSIRAPSFEGRYYGKSLRHLHDTPSGKATTRRVFVKDINSLEGWQKRTRSLRACHDWLSGCSLSVLDGWSATPLILNDGQRVVSGIPKLGNVLASPITRFTGQRRRYRSGRGRCAPSGGWQLVGISSLLRMLDSLFPGTICKA